MIVRQIELKKIHPSKLNPRLEVDISRLNELAASIREVGLLQPVILRPLDAEYEVVLGERRYRASQQAGLEKIFGVGARFIEILIMKNLHAKIGQPLEIEKECSLEFVEYVSAVEHNFLKQQNEN